MFVDASALTAMIVREEDAGQLAGRLEASTMRFTSPIALWETIVASSRVLDLPVADVSTDLRMFLARYHITCAPIAEEVATAAAIAFDRFGKGRHPARLNLGDCFAYACARHHGVPLLYKGEDFSKTDIEAA